MKRLLGAALAGAVTLLPTIAAAEPRAAGTVRASSDATTIAVLGDTPYGAAQFEAFDSLVTAVNGDGDVQQVLHVGDIKNGSSRCDTTYFEAVADAFSTFEDPVAYTPGDNEWTDCHRANNGAYDPLERLAEVRRIFFAEPDRTLGRRSRAVVTQAADARHATFLENARWIESKVAFATLHAVGSDNGRAPWTPDDPARRLAEVQARTAAALAWIDATFDAAASRGLAGVVLAMQADTWTAGGATRSPGFTEINERIMARAAAFDGDVLVLQGDTHRYVADRPAPNVQRVVVEGETIGEYLRLTVDPRAARLFRTERVSVPPAPEGRGRRDDVLVIGHRGASGYRPEHTVAAYELAIEQCADYIEPDLVSTADGVLVARHENEIGGTTDIGDRPEFAGLKTTKVIDGVPITGWFTEDLTLAQLKSLRAKERIPQTRPQNTAFDGQFEVPTLQEVIDLARRSRRCDGGRIGIYPETKHPTYFDGIGLSMEEELVRVLDANGYRSEQSPVIIQSFEVGNLRELATMTQVRIAQLVNCSGRPYDFVATGDPRAYADLVTPVGLDFVATYADGVGACKDVLLPRDAAGNLQAPSPVIDDAHERGLTVHGWTFRRENQFLPTSFRSSSDRDAPGDVVGEIRAFVAAGIDGVFTDNPDLGVAAVGS